jgi:hypothetical protein
MEVTVKGKKCGMGRGRNKKEAEQRAAMHALLKLKTDDKARKKENKGIRNIISQVRKRIKI